MDRETFSAVFEMAKSLFPKGCISPRMVAEANGYESFAITTCGSKSGWPEAEKHNTNIETLINYMHMYDFDDGTSSIEWAVVEYGHDRDYKIEEQKRQYEMKKMQMEIRIKKQKELLERQQEWKDTLESINKENKKDE
jgi:hypothetical protein